MIWILMWRTIRLHQIAFFAQFKSNRDILKRTKLDDTITKSDVAISLCLIQRDHLACCVGWLCTIGGKYIRHFIMN